MFKLFREFYQQERYHYRTWRSLWRATRRITRKVYFNLFQRRKAMKKFEEFLYTYDYEKPYSKSVVVNVSCDKLLTPQEADQIVKESQIG